MNYPTVQFERFSPPCQGGVAAASIKSCEATATPQTGAQRERDSAKHKEWSITRYLSERIPKHSSRLTTPSAPLRNGTILLMARPPLLGKEGNMPARNSFTPSQPWVNVSRDEPALKGRQNPLRRLRPGLIPGRRFAADFYRLTRPSDSPGLYPGKTWLASRPRWLPTSSPSTSRKSVVTARSALVELFRLQTRPAPVNFPAT